MSIATRALRRMVALIAAPIVTIAAGGALMLTLASAFAAESGDFNSLNRSVFRIHAIDAQGRVNRGSAVLVAPRTLVTNCHVVLHARDVTVSVAAGRRDVRLTHAHAERDLCLLDAPGLEGVGVTLAATTDKSVGEAISAVGFPDGRGLRISHGRIEGLYSYDGMGRVVQGSAPFREGTSGGALFDAGGKLIGILTFKARVGGPYHFAVPSEWVAALLLSDPLQSGASATAKPFWQWPPEQRPLFLRATALAADGDCAGLVALTAQWLEREPVNAEALLLAERARRCNTQ